MQQHVGTTVTDKLKKQSGDTGGPLNVSGLTKEVKRQGKVLLSDIGSGQGKYADKDGFGRYYETSVTKINGLKRNVADLKSYIAEHYGYYPREYTKELDALNAQLGDAQTALVKEKQNWKKAENTAGLPGKTPGNRQPVDGVGKNGYNNDGIRKLSQSGTSDALIKESDQNMVNRINSAKIKQSDENMVKRAAMENAKKSDEVMTQRAALEAEQTSSKNSDGNPARPVPKQTPSINPNPTPTPEAPRPEDTEETKFFDTMDDAAHYFLLKYQGQSQKEEKEYGTVIRYSKEYKKYYLGPVFVGGEQSVPEMWANIVFLGGDATVHTHPKAYEYSNECYFSKGELFTNQWFGDNWLPGVRYLGAPIRRDV